MFSKEQLQSFQSHIDSSSRIAIFGHESVDGDAIGSMLGLGMICEKLWKHVGYFTTIAPSSSFLFLPHIDKIQTDFDYSDDWDLIIFVDFTPYSRIGKITEGHEAYFDNKPTLIVDHHIGDTVGPKAIVLKDVDASSNCELLYEITKELYPELLDAEIATYWYLGLLTDTGNFQFEVDSVRTMSNALALIKLGAKKAWIIEKLFNNNSWSSIEFLKMIIPRITLTDKVCYVRYTMDEIENFGFDKEEADIMILANIKPLKNVWAFAIIRDGGTGKIGISLRSGYLENDTRISVQKVALALGGWGHEFASGAKVDSHGEFETQVKELVETINREIEKQL